MPDWKLHSHSDEDTLAILDELADVYIQGYAADADAGRSIYSRDAFLERTTHQAKSPGFTLVTGRADSELAGFSFGLPFSPGRWWQGDASSDPPSDLKDAPKFAVIELVVAPSFQGQGLAGRLIRTLPENRSEPYAMLLAERHGRARVMYDRWGWQAIQTLRPAPDVQELAVLVMELGP